jgi:RNA polymerase sigma-70 factor (ECF subfamily)
MQTTLERMPTLEEEDDLIQRTLAGDRDAFTPLILKYKDQLFDLACRILGSKAEAEDALQDAFLEAYRHLAGFNHKSRFSTWVYSIVLNRVRNRLRHNKVIRWSSLDAPRTDDEDSRVPDVADRGPSFPVVLEHQLELEQIEKEVKNLPFNYQSIFIMHYFQDMPIDQIAEELNRPVGTIKVYLHRARKLLYKQLKATGRTLPAPAMAMPALQEAC